jgi:DNA-binding CsgD family transcriptional regulator
LCPELIAEIACGSLERPTFESEVLHLLNDHVGAEVLYFCGAHGPGEISLGLDQKVRRAAGTRWDQISREAADMLPVAQRLGGVIVDTELLGPRLTSFTFYETLMEPHRGRTTLLGFLRCHGRPVGSLVLGRCLGSPDFRREHQEALRRILPTLSIAQFAYGQGAMCQTWPSRDARGTLERSLTLCVTSLNARERDIARLVAKGSSNREIAQQLLLSANTVKKYLKVIFSRLEVSSRAELAWLVTSAGMV